MDHSSDEDTEISDSEIDDYEGKIYARLMSGDLMVKKNGESYSCPFCSSKKKNNFSISSLVQHASGVSAAPNRQAKEKATHRALVKHLKNDLIKSPEPRPQVIPVEPQPLQNRDEKFVWPWMGILVNVPTEWKDGRQVGESGNRLKGQLSNFCPLKVIPLWTFRGHTGNAIVEFGKDWNGFRNARTFESHFAAGGHGKKDWIGKKNKGSELYGWLARAEDYNSPGLIGDHLRKNGDLKSVNDLAKEGARKTDKLVANLANQIEVKNRYLQELECKYSETTASLEKMMGQREQLLQSYNEGLLYCFPTPLNRYLVLYPMGADLESMRVDTNFLSYAIGDTQKYSYIASMGVYVFKRDALLDLLKSKYNQLHDFGSEILPRAVLEHNVQAYIFTGYWEDVGTIKSFFDANLALTDQPSKFEFYDPQTPFFTAPRYLPPTQLDKCKIKDAFISDGCLLSECTIKHSVIGVCSRLSSGCELMDTMMMGADIYQTEEEASRLLLAGKVPIGIGENTKIRNCIIDMNARIGKNVVIANSKGIQEADHPEEGYYIRSGIVVILKNAIIKDGSVI